MGPKVTTRVSIAVIMLVAAGVRSGPPAEAVTPPRLSIRFEILLTPDAEAAALGVKPRRSFVEMDNGYWSDASTGAGCVPQPFQSSRIAMRATRDGYELEAVNPASNPEDSESNAHWVATLKGGMLTGELWETMRGKAVTGEELRVEREKAVAHIRNERTVRINGKVVNQAEVDALVQLVLDEQFERLARGRTLHYTFTTTKVSLTPTGARLKFLPADVRAEPSTQKTSK